MKQPFPYRCPGCGIEHGYAEPAKVETFDAVRTPWPAVYEIHWYPCKRCGDYIKAMRTSYNHSTFYLWMAKQEQLNLPARLLSSTVDIEKVMRDRFVAVYWPYCPLPDMKKDAIDVVVHHAESNTHDCKVLLLPDEAFYGGLVEQLSPSFHAVYSFPLVGMEDVEGPYPSLMSELTIGSTFGRFGYDLKAMHTWPSATFAANDYLPLARHDLMLSAWHSYQRKSLPLYFHDAPKGK